jgi:YegS/Rv2252/BmrU family lipid kinase
MTRRVTVIANPIAGRGRAARLVPPLRAGLAARGFEVEVAFTGAKGDARALAATLEGKADLAVAVGGDGTVNEILNGLALRPPPLGVVPAGTSTVIGLDLALPRKVERAVEALARGKTRRIDVARANGRLAALFVGVGFDGMVVRELEARRRGPIRKSQYVPAFLRALRGYRAPALRIETEEGVHEGFSFALISNVTYYGGLAFPLKGERSLEDGCFELWLFRAGTRLDLIRLAANGLLRRLRPDGDVRRVRARRVRIEGNVPVPIQIDGDLGGTTPLELEVIPRAFEVVVP